MTARAAFATAVLFVAGTFALDVVTPLGVAVPVLYLIPVLLSRFAPSDAHARFAGVAGTALTAAGAVVSPGGDSVVGAVNRALALLAIWATTSVVTRARSAERGLQARNAALRESQRQLEDFRYALDQAAIVAVTDRAGRIRHANDKFCAISGYGRDELLGSDHRLINSGAHPRAFWADLWRTISAGGVWRGEVRNRAKAGSTYWVDTTVVPLKDAAGRVDRYLAIRFDITDRKLAEARLREQAALARLGEMAAVVAHEVKNPLTGIGGALQIIGERLPPDSRERGVIRDIRARIDALNRSVQDLLVYARPRAPQRGRVRLHAVLSDTAALLAADPEAGRAQVRWSGDDGELYADGAMLREVFLNLALNAAQAMNGVGTIRMESVVAGGECRVVVADEGPGIPEELRERVWEPFFSTRSRGTGLGLSIVRRVVEEHEGTLSIECPPDGGTRVHLAFPLAPPIARD